MALLQSVILLALVAFNLFTTGNGWRLDEESCDRHPKTKDRLLKGLPKALSLVDNAVKMLEDNDDETYSIRDMLFPKLPFKELGKPREALQKVSKSMTLNSGRDAGVKDMRDPIIFCDLDRFEKIASVKAGEPDAYRNKLTNKIDDDPNGMLVTCMNEKKITGYSSRFEGEDSANSQDFIQLCPWWLKLMERDDVQKDLSKWDDAKWAKMNLDHYDFKPTQETWLDTIYTFERTLIHEFSHTANGGMTADMKGPDGSTLYGWQKCASPPLGLKMYNNADSVALFCVATDLANKKMQRPMKDGNLKRLCAGPGKPYPGSNKKCDIM